MGVYVDHQIRELLKLGVITAEGGPEPSVQPSSLDLHLAGPILRQQVREDYDPYESDEAKRRHYALWRPVDLRDPQDHHWTELKPKVCEQGRSWFLEPGAFVLGCTSQVFHLPPSVSVKVEGKSTLGRAGLIIETAGWVEAGFQGSITLEILNVGKRTLRIWEHMPICQAVFHSHHDNSYADKPYSGQYQGQTTTRVPGGVR